MNRIITILLLVMLSAACTAKTPVYKDPKAPIEKRIDDLIPRMTLEEKVMQTNQWAYGKNMNVNNIETQMKSVSPLIGSLIYRSTSPVFYNQIQRKAMEESRLGIPIICGFDVIHGYRTIFPIPLGQSCSWNADLVRESCRIAARESSQSGVVWTFSPMVDVARDSRWGRVSEGYGEDPYANSVFGVAAIKGYQGDNLADKNTIAACIKHYVGYSLSDGGRDYHYSEVSRQTMWDTFMLPYEEGIKAGAATVMCGFNDISGVPASANYYTLTEVLKKRWGHDGFVVSDWGSISNLVAQGVAKDDKESCLKAFMAGVEMDMVDDIYINNMAQLVNEKKIPMATLDEAVRRILRLKFRLGLFENPYIEELSDSERYLLPQDMAVAKELAAESMVLLKNNKNTLPLSADVKNIALLGPLANDSVSLMGTWEGQGQSKDVRTIYDGMLAEFKGRAAINYARGCELDGKSRDGFEAALALARAADVVVLCMGEKKNWSGENGSRSTLALPAIQEAFVAEVNKLGKPIVMVLSSGRPLELIRIEPLADAIVEIWQPGLMGGPALAEILSGKVNPSGRLSITFPLTTSQQPMYYNLRQSARPTMGYYQDIPREPMYRFGHGLSYTSYDYGKVTLSKSQIKRDEKIVAQVEVANTGTVDGKETLLWFISDPVATISRPMKELKFFDKKVIKAGERVVYRFEIDPSRDLSFVDAQGDRHLEAGEFFVTVKDQKVRFEIID